MGRREIRVLDRKFLIEWGELANQADGAVLIRENDTTLLVTAVASEEPRPGIDFFPLTVDYRERFSAVGRFPGGYRKREGQAAVHEILTSRLIDRSIRPLFPQPFLCDTQLLATVLSFDPDGDPAVLAIVGASAALQLSGIPWDGPVAGIRVGRSREGALIANPLEEDRAGTDLDLIVSANRKGLVMVEGGTDGNTEVQVLEALRFAEEKVDPLLTMLEELRGEGRPKRQLDEAPLDSEVVRAVTEIATESIRGALTIPGKQDRRARLQEVQGEILAALADRYPKREAEVSEVYKRRVDQLYRDAILEGGKRADGRTHAEIRPIVTKVGWIPRVHGSALFTRGETQAVAVCTLGTGQDEQEIERLSGVEREAFQLYYKFPPYSVGEVRPMRAPGRREIGHGTLARRALAPVLPPQERFSYTIKVESEITSSNGSSSMATVCAGCLALMDAGVPIDRPVAGIAMGLIREGEKTAILSDILGDEDHLGDMDFKIAGTEKGITALQLDNKVGALSTDLLATAVEQAREGRLLILAEMAKSLVKPRAHLSAFAPRVEVLSIGVHRIRTLIGAGGRVIQAVQADTETKINVSDDGTVRIYAPSSGALEMAVRRVRDLTGEPEVGKIYRGSVVAAKEFGVFVRLFEGIEGLVHVSELAEGRIEDPTRIAAAGDEMVVLVLGVDNQGKIKLSRKQAANVPESEIETG